MSTAARVSSHSGSGFYASRAIWFMYGLSDCGDHHQKSAVTACIMYYYHKYICDFSKMHTCADMDAGGERSAA